MQTVITTIIIVVLIVGLVSAGHNPTVSPREKEAIKRTGRIGLWLTLPPLGLWRSWKHGQRKRDERLARMIREDRRS